MKKLVFLIFLMLFTTSFWSQEVRPKIGLVLSGGGAKGFAHIGVLKEIDRAGIRLDYIGGTSMGAVIGGLYAAGYSGLQIETLVTKLDFESLLRDELPRSAAPFFDKEYAENTNVTLPVIEGNKIGIPEGVSKGQNVLNTFYELLGHVEDIQDFAKLPIPFFCIATDAATGDPYLLESGALPIALRASGSLPTLLNPVSYQDKLLVDGGISNNFPVGIAKSKGMDIIIGVNVQSELLEKEKLTSIVKVLNQIVSYQMYRKSDEERKGVDIYIRPDILDYQVVDFAEKEALLQIGDAKALEYRPVFEALAKKQNQSYSKPLIKVDSKSYLVSKITINGLSNYTRAYVLGKLNIKEGDSLTRKQITQKIDLLSATKNYERIDYKITELANNSFELVFNLLESSPNATVSLGAHYDLLYKSGILVNYKKKQLLTNNDQFSLDVILGDNFRYNLNYFVDNGFYISYGFRSRYNHFRDNVRFNLTSLENPNISNISLNFSDITNQLYFQTTFSRKFAIGVGAEHKYISATTRTVTVNDEATVLDQSSYFNTYGYLKLDTYDKKHFVTKGFYADLNFRWFMSSTDYNNDFSRFSQASGTLGFATTFFDKLTFQLINEAGFTFDPPTSNVFDFYLGGYNQNYINNFISFYGFDFSELSNDSFVKSTFQLRYQLAKKQYLSVLANYARVEANVFKDIDIFKNTISGYAIGYSLDTFIGPIELKYSWSPDSNQNFWLFNLGFWF